MSKISITTPAEALQAILDVSATIMHNGKVRTGTPESGKLIAAYRYFAELHGVGRQYGNVGADYDD